MTAACLRIETPSAPYDIIIGDELLKKAGQYLSPLLPSKKAIIISDKTVAGFYLDTLTQSLAAAGFSLIKPVILPPGESTKNFSQLEKVVNHALENNIDRKTALIALGGGVIGDIAGFAASILLRGLPFVQLPTTLLAQVDSAIGGKTAINALHGKNLVGSFYQPKIVLSDTATLATLPERELKAGYAEILKYALIGDDAFFTWLEKNGKDILAGNKELQRHAIKTSCEAKAAVVLQDEKEEKDIRALLNLGHSFAHALEAIGGYDGRLLHGEAVSIGLNLAARFSASLELCPAADARKIERHLSGLDMPLAAPFPVTAEQILENMRKDKKFRDGKITLVLLRGIGDAFVEKNTDEETLKIFLKRNIGQ